MLGAKGITVNENTPSRSRATLMAERKSQNIQVATQWNQAQQSKFLERKRSRLSFADVAVNNLLGKKPRPKTAEEAPTGVRRIAGRSGVDCTTYFKDNPSIKTFASKKNQSTRGILTTASGAAPSSTAATASPRQPTRPQTARTHRSADVSGKISCEGFPGAPQPPFLSISKMHIRRPEITTLDSYDVPIFSCFSMDKKFHPRIDDTLSKIKDKKAKEREEARRAIAEKYSYHVNVVVKQFNAEEERQREIRMSAQPFTSSSVPVPIPLPPQQERAGSCIVTTPFDPHTAMQQQSKASKKAEFIAALSPMSQSQMAASTAAAVVSPQSVISEDRRSDFAARRSSLSPPMESHPTGMTPTPPRRATLSVPEAASAIPPPAAAGRSPSSSTTGGGLQPRPPIARRRPHTAGASRLLQHAVAPHTVLDAHPEMVETIHPAVVTPRQTAESTGNRTPMTRPHSARPISSANMAIDAGGISGTTPLLSLLAHGDDATRQSAPRSNCSAATIMCKPAAATDEDF